MNATPMPRPLRSILYGLLLPATLYALLYAAFTYPLLRQFSTHYFCGQEDGYQNIWNLWWVNKAVADLHTTPWYTTFLHYPTGTTLIAHTLAPFNGFLGIPLQKLGLSLAQTYNTIVLFSFVTTGLTTFWLARRVTGAYLGSLFAGAAFTFSHFHFAHAQNHLQMVSLEWMPLALLAVYELLTRPTPLKALAAAGAMLLVALSDFHLTFYVVVAGSLLGIVTFARLAATGFVDLRKYALPLGLFVTLTAATTGLLALKLLHVNRTDPLQQNHDPTIWSTDLVDPVVPGHEWRFADWTKSVWAPLAEPGKDFVYVEHSLYVGWAVLLLVAWAVWRQRAIKLTDFGYWIGLATLFFLLSLGPRIHVWGHITRVPGVYPVLEKLFPPLKMGGVPMRLMAMVLLTTSILAAAAIADLLRLIGRRAPLVLIPLFALWAFESLPKPQPTTPATYPFWVQKLRGLPPGAVIDTTYKTDMSRHLYYATGHGHPVGEGYISRYPRSVEQRRGQFRALVDAEAWPTLHRDWGFKYLVIDHHVPNLKALIQDGDTRVYQLAP